MKTFKEKKKYNKSFMRGDKIVKNTKESERILTGKKCEICGSNLELGQTRVCYSCELLIY